MSQCPECQENKFPNNMKCWLCGGTGQVTIDYLIRKIKWYKGKLEDINNRESYQDYESRKIRGK
jgi:hypothetical protein